MAPNEVAMMESAKVEDQGFTETKMEVDEGQSNKATPTTETTPLSSDITEPAWVGHLKSIDIILGGEKTIALHQEFLIRNNHSDLQILKNTKVY